MRPFRFDPVEQQTSACELSQVERVREAIYRWMDCETGTQAEHAAWERFRASVKAWLKRGE